MSDNRTYKPLNLNDSLAKLNDLNQIQQIKSVGSQPRPASTSPNAINNTNARALSTPRHVTNVHATLSRTSDVSSKVSVTFQRDPTDYYFSNAQVYVSGYKGNPAPVLVGSGQSPVSFSLENTGEPVSVTVQAVGNLGPAPLSTAPNATLKLDKTALVTVATTAGNGTGGSSLTLQTNEVNNGSQSVLDLHAGANTTLTDNGSGRVTIDTGCSITSANQGFFFSTGTGWETPQATATISLGAGNLGKVLLWQFCFDRTQTIRKVSIRCTSGATGALWFVGMYDINGNLLFQTPSISGASGATNQSVTLGSPYTLKPGVYYLGLANTVASAGLEAFTNPDTTFLFAINTSNMKLGLSTNSVSGTTMPATTGAITSTTAFTTIPLILFEG